MFTNDKQDKQDDVEMLRQLRLLYNYTIKQNITHITFLYKIC